MKEIRYAKQPLKALRNMQKSRARAIIEKIETYARGEPVDAIKMSGSSFVRIRVGQWRVIIDDEGVVLVIRIKPRGDVYK